MQFKCSKLSTANTRLSRPPVLGGCPVHGFLRSMSEIPANFPIPSSASTDASSNTSAATVQQWGDILGLVASVGCAVHCAVTPVVIAFLPTWGLSWLGHPSVHQWMFYICLLVGIAAFIPGLKRHRKIMPVVIGCIGLAIVGTAAFIPGNGSMIGNWIVPWLTPVGGVLLVLAHLLNHHFGHACDHFIARSPQCCSGHCH